MIRKKLLMLAACLLLLTGCTTTPTTKVLIDEPALLATAEGHNTITLTDRSSGLRYKFHTRLRKRTQGAVEAHRAVETSTITINTLPGGGLEIVTLTDSKVYEITHRWGVF